MRVPLLSGAYQSRSLIASAQRAINLYPETNPEESQPPVPVTHFLTPGLTLLATAPNIEEVRQTYTATNGDLYVCVGPQVYYVNAAWKFTLLGSIADARTPVSFSDNGIVVVLVDGSNNGYCIDITPPSISGNPTIPRTWGQIVDPNFLGSNFVDYIDTFFVFNQRGTYNLYISLSEVSFAMLTQTSVGTGMISSAGSGYQLGTYSSVPLTGGSGTGALGTITVQDSILSAGTISAPGTAYKNGSYPGVPLTGGSGTGAIADLVVSVATGTVTPGSAYTNGSYANAPMTGGTGTGMLANIVIGGGTINSVVVTENGTGYAVGDALSASGLGSGTGFQFRLQTVGGGISSVTLDSGGVNYQTGDVLSVDPASLGGGGSGFQWDATELDGAVTGVTIDQGGQGYTVGNVLTAPASSIGGSGSGFSWTVQSMAPAFDPLDIAAKSGSADPIQRVVVMFRTVWPLGTKTSEAWIDTGAADFALQPLPGVFIEHGCVAPFSVANFDRSSFWLAQDRQGRAVVVKIQGYNVVEVSTHAIVTIFQGYQKIDDAIGFTFQQNGHVFYGLTFPTANATWLLDIQTGQWCQWAYTDNNGVLNRHRANCCCFAYGTNVVGDWQNGNLYSLDFNNYTDNGQPITRIRSFPHMIQDGARVTYTSFIADVQVGTEANITSDNPPLISLRWSDDRGATFGNPVMQTMGAGGQYLTSVKWNRLGMARDRVFELQWSAPMNTALNGCFVEFIKHKT